MKNKKGGYSKGILLIYNKRNIFLLGILCLILLSSFINPSQGITKSYDNENKKVSISNSGNSVVDITLLTPLDNHVGLGYQMVAKVNMTFYEKPQKFLGGMNLYDKKNKDVSIIRTIDYKYLTTENVDVPDYSCVDSGLTNGSKNCIQIGTHKEDREIWLSFDESKPKNGETYIIGLFTDVKEGDKVEWIPTWFQVRISEWATWTAGLNVGLVHYYKLDELSGNATDNVGTTNSSWVNGTIYGSSGKIGTSYYISYGNGNAIQYSSYLIGGTRPATFNAWIKPENVTDSLNHYLFSEGESDSIGWQVILNNGKIYLTSPGVGNTPNTLGTLAAQTYSMVSFNISASQVTFWINGSYDSTSGLPGGSVAPYSGKTLIGACGHGAVPAGPVDSIFGNIDEIGIWNRSLSPIEFSQLYNSGIGITYDITKPTVSQLVSPKNGNISNSASQIFSIIAFDDSSLDTVGLYINFSGSWIVNQTNHTGVNNTQVNLSVAGISDGYYIWTGWSNDSSGNSIFNDTNYTLTIDTTSPSVIYQSDTSSSGWRNQNFIIINISSVDVNPSSNMTEFNGTNQTFTNFAGNYSWINKTLLSDGNYTFFAWANDTANNTGSLEIRTIGIDTTSPTIGTTTTYTTAGSQTFIFNSSATDLGSGLHSTFYTILNSSGMVDTATIANTTFTINTNVSDTVSAYGTYTLRVWANDTASNYASLDTNFTTSASSGSVVIVSGGGGGGTTTLTIASNFSVVTTNYKNILDFISPKESANPREVDFYLTNSGLESIDLALSCSTEDSNQSSGTINICDYVSFKNDSYTLIANSNNPQIATLSFIIPENASIGDVYYFNILGTSGSEYSKLSAKVSVTTLGGIYRWVKIFGDYTLPLFPILIFASFGVFILMIFIFIKVNKPTTGILVSMLSVIAILYFGLVL